MASSSSPICLRCYASDKSRIELVEQYATRELVCPTCGIIDQARSLARNLVGEASFGGAVFDDHEIMGTWQGEWRQNKSLDERRYKNVLDGLLNTYLVEARSCILPEPDPELKRPSIAVFEKIRKGEMKRKQRTATIRGDGRDFPAQMNPYSRLFPYQVVVAIRIAAEQRAISYLNERLKRDSSKDQVTAKSAPGVTPVAPPLWELFKGSHKMFDAATGRLDDYHYLDRTLRISCGLINHSTSMTDDILCLFLQAIRRFKLLASFTCHEDRLPHLVSKPLVGEGKNAVTREWRETDWSYFDNLDIDWERVLEIGHNLYQAQLCVKLWIRVGPAQCAIALCLVALSGVLREVIPQQLNVVRELSLEFGLPDNVANERFRDLKKFVIAWSTSLKDLNMAFPQVNPPRVGGLGDGYKNYASDLRRGIPEQEILAVVAVDVAERWEELAQVRHKTRKEGRTFKAELHDARGQAAAAGMRLEPFMMCRKLREEVERNASREFAAALLSATDQGGKWDDQEMEEYNEVHGPRSPPPTPPLHPARIRDDGLEALLEADEKSSDGGSEYSTDDETERPGSRMKATPLTGHGLDLSGLGDSDEPFAFTIGPDGFSRATDDPTPHDDPTRVNKLVPAPPAIASSAGLSLLSLVSQGMSRQPSESTLMSEPYGYSASETERIILSRNFLAGRNPPRKTLPASRAQSVTSESTTGTAHSASGSSIPMPTTPTSSTTPLRDISSVSGGSDLGLGGFRTRTTDEGTTEHSLTGILEREKRFYTTDRKASRAVAQAKRDHDKAEKVAAGWVRGQGAKRKVSGVEGGGETEQVQKEKATGKKRKVSRLNKAVDPVIAALSPDFITGAVGMPPSFVPVPFPDEDEDEKDDD